VESYDDLILRARISEEQSLEHCQHSFEQPALCWLESDINQ